MLIERVSQWGEATFRDPASAQMLDEAEIALRHPLPNDLRELLGESNGIEGEYGLGLLWSIERIARDNHEFRTGGNLRELYMPFDGILFFADAGNGDQFGLSLSGNNDVFAWDHEDDSRRWVADSALAYLEAWMTGRLTI